MTYQKFQKTWTVSSCTARTTELQCPRDCGNYLATGARIEIAFTNYPGLALTLVDAQGNEIRISSPRIRGYGVKPIEDSDGQFHDVPFLQTEFLDARNNRKQLELNLIHEAGNSEQLCDLLLRGVAEPYGRLQCGQIDPGKDLVHWSISTLSRSNAAHVEDNLTGKDELEPETPPDDSQGTGTG
ncbi:MAG: hypothetical protein V2J10_12015 [Wenzhouxiangella sp.]|jgi:hypothetical protein|nr:hypothetical protein [Wenzhouxiangella sp.]